MTRYLNPYLTNCSLFCCGNVTHVNFSYLLTTWWSFADIQEHPRCRQHCRSKVKVKVTLSKIFIPTERTWIHMCNMNAVSVLVQKLCVRLSFSKVGWVRSRSYGSRFLCTNKNVLPQGISTCNMKALSLLVKKLCLRLSFFNSRSDVKVKVTWSKVLVQTKRFCDKVNKWVIWKPNLFWFKIIPSVKFISGETDGQTNRQGDFYIPHKRILLFGL